MPPLYPPKAEWDKPREMGDSGDYVFYRGEDGHLNYRGAFDNLYRAMPDPWGQSGGHPRMQAYYEYSRSNLVMHLLGVRWSKLLEVGCGTGNVVNHINEHLPGRDVHGCDISKTAVERARIHCPKGYFYPLDIAADDAVLPLSWYARYYDVAILSQILWYILDRLPGAINNCAKLLVPGGHLIIQTAFLDNQEYGKNIVDGWRGLIRWVLDSTVAWEIVAASYDDTSRFAPHHDGILVLRRMA